MSVRTERPSFPIWSGSSKPVKRTGKSCCRDQPLGIRRTLIGKVGVLKALEFVTVFPPTSWLLAIMVKTRRVFIYLFVHVRPFICQS